MTIRGIAQNCRGRKIRLISKRDSQFKELLCNLQLGKTLHPITSCSTCLNPGGYGLQSKRWWQASIKSLVKSDEHECEYRINSDPASRRYIIWGSDGESGRRWRWGRSKRYLLNVFTFHRDQRQAVNFALHKTSKKYLNNINFSHICVFGLVW